MVLVLDVIQIAPNAPDLLSANVQNAPGSVLFSHPMNVAYRSVAEPSIGTLQLRHARIATRVA